MCDERGNRRRLSRSDFEFIYDAMSDIKRTPFRLLKASLERRDLWYMGAFLHIVVKELLLNRRTQAERGLLIGRFIGVAGDWSFLELRFRGRALKIPRAICLRYIPQIIRIFVRNQYNLSEETAKGKVIVDVGANIGMFSALSVFMGARKVYALEPVPETFEMLKSTIALNGLGGVVVPLNVAAGDSDGFGEINYDFPGDSHASIGLYHNKTPGRRVQRVKILKLDSFLHGKQVDFIKIDSEGYEKEVLLGAKTLLRKHKPVLSFSAYHFPSDKTVLPKVVKGIRGDYRIKLNHFAEEDFYCW